jgi:hypothetical protein
MKITFSSILALTFISLSSCSVDCFQYDVYVQNDTSTAITVEHKSWVDHTRKMEDTIVLEPGDQTRIISSFDYIEELDGEGMRPEHCSRIADYVNATRSSDGAVADDVWCGDDVLLKQVDIGQAEFYVIFKDEHFE